MALADLPGSLLALTAGPAITLDRDAGGWGWFTDTSLASHTQFEDGRALAGSPAADRIDLLTVLVHELGHVLGLDHDSFGVMHEGLAAGTRLAGTPDDPPEASSQSAPARPPVSDEPAMVSAATLLDAAVGGDASPTVRAPERLALSDPAGPTATGAPAAPTSSGGTSDAEQDVDLDDTPSSQGPDGSDGVAATGADETATQPIDRPSARGPPPAGSVPILAAEGGRVTVGDARLTPPTGYATPGSQAAGAVSASVLREEAPVAGAPVLIASGAAGASIGSARTRPSRASKPRARHRSCDGRPMRDRGRSGGFR